MSFRAAQVFAAITILACYLVHRVQRWRALNELAVKNGCEEICLAQNLLPFGIDRKYKLLTCKGNVLDEVLTARFESLGRYMYKEDRLNNPPIMCAEPEAVKAVLAGNFSDWSLDENRYPALGPWLGHGIFISDHDGANSPWAAVRRILRASFSQDALYSTHLTAPFLHDFTSAAGQDSQGWTLAPDLAPLIRRFTLDLTTAVFCGGSIYAQEKGSAAKAAAANKAVTATGAGEERRINNSSNLAALEIAFDHVNKWAGRRLQSGKLYWLFNPQAFKDACEDFSSFAFGRADEAIASVQSGKVKSRYTDGTDFVEHLAEKTSDRRLIRDVLTQMLFAGIDTSTSMLSFTLLEFGRTPGAWSRLRAELDAKGLLSSSPDSWSTTQLKECAYLQNSITETLRMYPPIPANTRQAIRDTILPVGGGPDGRSPIAVPKGTIIKFSVYVMQRRKDIFGPDAHEWNPDRWASRRHGWEYLPFNGGPRICLGQKFVLIHGAYILARLAQTYDDIEARIPESVINTRFETALFPRNGVPVKLHAAKIIHSSESRRSCLEEASS